MIRLRKLTKVYRAPALETMALREIELEVLAGEFVAIMGPSGSGKSTLLNIVGMLDSPTGGEYWFGGQNIARFSERRLSQLRKQAVGFVFQNFNLVDDLTVRENVELALLYHRNISATDRRNRVDAVLNRLAIDHRANHTPQQLSGGQQQLVAIARAIVSEPLLLLADEPTGNLDSENGESVMALLSELHEAGTTLLMVTHSSLYAGYADRVVNLLDGAIVTENVRRVA